VTRALIVQIAGGELGAKLRSQVKRWHPGATRDQVEDAFQEACARAERSCRGQSEGEVFTWLRTTTFRI
jgi:DNA-directed RNA polymerase specialized sigma24 family protein